jgi:hypothetical protein
VTAFLGAHNALRRQVCLLGPHRVVLRSNYRLRKHRVQYDIPTSEHLTGDCVSSLQLTKLANKIKALRTWSNTCKGHAVIKSKDNKCSEV